MRDLTDYQEKYSEEGFEEYKVHYRRKKILEVVDQYHPGSILEIGCGMDPLFQWLRFDKYVFFEPGELFFQNASALSQGNQKIIGINQPFTKEGLDKSVGPFDLIVCTSLLHELEKPEIMVADMREAAGEDTIIHISVPNGHSFHRLLAVAMKIVKDEKEFSERNIRFQQNRVFDVGSLTDLVEKNGLQVIEQGDYFIKPFTHNQMYQMMQHHIINEDVLDGLYELSKFIPGIGSELYVNCKRK